MNCEPFGGQSGHPAGGQAISEATARLNSGMMTTGTLLTRVAEKRDRDPAVEEARKRELDRRLREWR